MKKSCRRATLLALTFAALVPAASRPADGASQTPADAWVAPMRAVHAKFTGQPGTFAHFGDSITVTLAYWTPLLYTRNNAPPEMEQAFALVKKRLRPECWRDWKGPEFGNEGSMTIDWAVANVDKWLAKLNPETVLIMFGTNDLNAMEVEAYRTKTRGVVRRILDNGTVVILSTIPPRHGFEKKATVFAQAIRELAAEMKVPLVDFHAEVLKRRPNDWDGAADQFKAYKDYDVPTLLARDGVHPSNPAKYQNDYSPEGLSHCGFGLRNYLALVKYAEVTRAVFEGDRLKPGLQPVASDALEPGLQPGAVSSPLALLPKAPPLPPPPGDAIRVSTVDELFRAAEQVKPGGTILLSDGHYMMPRYFEIHTDNVTLRGSSGDPRRVVLDGAKSNHGELVGVSRCSGVTIADITIQNVKWNGFKLNTDTNVQRVTIHHCVIHNIWERGVKVPEAIARPTGFRIQYCLFYNDRPKRYSDDPSDTAANFGGDYVGGIDAMFAKNWSISDNVFTGIHGRTGGARGAVFLWHDTQDCVIERNRIIDCDSGICLGNSHRPEDIKIHCTRCIVRNNFVTRAPENAILADYTRDCLIVHNTVYDPASRMGRLIRIVHDADGLVVANNLLCGPKIRNESTGRIEFSHNIERDLGAALVDLAHGDLHLTARATEAIHQAGLRSDVISDIDGDPRGGAPDIGADQFKK
ncbi:MAG: GDSL-type esterase/lipase family protein [Pirellulales bacterium]